MVPAFCVARSPKGISAVERGAIWSQYATAWGGLVDCAGVSADDIVLVTAASSSAALGGLQIAKNAGAMVIAATRKAEKAEFLRGAGADHVIAIEEEDLESRVKEITPVARVSPSPTIPWAAPSSATSSRRRSPAGLIVSYGNLRTEPIDIHILPMLAKRLDIKFHSVFDTVRLPEKRSACFAFVHDHVAAGALKVIVDRTFPLEQVVDAHRYMESNVQRGKIVVTT